MITTLVTNFVFAIQILSNHVYLAENLYGRPIPYEEGGVTQMIVSVNSIRPEWDDNGASIEVFDGEGERKRDMRLACPHRNPLNGNRNPPLYEWDREVGHYALMFRRGESWNRGQTYVYARRIVTNAGGSRTNRNEVVFLPLGIAFGSENFRNARSLEYGDYVESMVLLK